MALLDDFKDGVSRLRKKVEEFKEEHTMISSAVSEIIDSLPGPFDAFGRVFSGTVKIGDRVHILREGYDSNLDELFNKILEGFQTKNINGFVTLASPSFEKSESRRAVPIFNSPPIRKRRIRR